MVQLCKNKKTEPNHKSSEEPNQTVIVFFPESNQTELIVR